MYQLNWVDTFFVFSNKPVNQIFEGNLINRLFFDYNFIIASIRIKFTFFSNQVDLRLIDRS